MTNTYRCIVPMGAGEKLAFVCQLRAHQVHLRPLDQPKYDTFADLVADGVFIPVKGGYDIARPHLKNPRLVAFMLAEWATARLHGAPPNQEVERYLSDIGIGTGAAVATIESEQTNMSRNNSVTIINAEKLTPAEVAERKRRGQIVREVRISNVREGLHLIYDGVIVAKLIIPGGLTEDEIYKLKWISVDPRYHVQFTPDRGLAVEVDDPRH